MTNGLTEAKAESAVETFCEAYVEVVKGYVGNEDAELFEVKASTTPKDTALHKFLKKMQEKDEDKAVIKFTERTSSGLKFVKSKDTSLEELPDDIEQAIREGFAKEGYPATLPKVAWHALEYSPASFKVLDVARRVGSGIGSFGVDRFYVLLAGEERPAAADDDAYDVPSDDRAAEEDKHSRRAVILDVKEEPSPAARDAFEATSGKTGDAAWFDHLFKNQAARAVKAQRAITSLTDPYAGWAKIDERDFVVRERSPYKASFDLDELDTYQDFAEYVRLQCSNRDQSTPSSWRGDGVPAGERCPRRHRRAPMASLSSSRRWRTHRVDVHRSSRSRRRRPRLMCARRWARRPRTSRRSLMLL